MIQREKWQSTVTSWLPSACRRCALWPTHSNAINVASTMMGSVPSHHAWIILNNRHPYIWKNALDRRTPTALWVYLKFHLHIFLQKNEFFSPHSVANLIRANNIIEQFKVQWNRSPRGHPSAHWIYETFPLNMRNAQSFIVTSPESSNSSSHFKFKVPEKDYISSGCNLLPFFFPLVFLVPKSLFRKWKQTNSKPL